jgi:murein DD-endopeptidase MepM/ murein hydrolase activator NlpD
MFNGVIFPIEIPRVTMPFRATETKWYTDEKPHRGVDLAPWPGSTGAAVRMPLYGTVVNVGEHTFAGKEIITQHVTPYRFGAHALDKAIYTVEANEVFYLRTAHHSAILAREGEKLRAGHPIARIGSTGLYTTGPHVHLELHKYGYPGLVLDPLDFFIAAIPGLRASLILPW